MARSLEATKKEYQIIVGQNLRRMRQERGLNQTEVSRRVGISQAQISKLENGTMGLGLIEASVVAKFFDCDLADLLNPI
jgi:transcriptional regulator with XRE-family HTH domain